MLEFLLIITAGAIGFILTRNFVRRRLRFVDAVHSPWAPLITGLLAAVLAWPAALLPFFSIVTAVAFGIGTGLGTASGARAIRMQSGARRQLHP
jgi:cytochrome c biogenesis protein CcdA